ncbi:hypothetical protein ACUHMQ_07750 [Chitinimonas sp. PSY-7]|uniref:hypothetical protein n=1 Tax=Chitinimonas sp. PSY-7 TaxID=3459088 RepID=UPI00403FE08B
MNNTQHDKPQLDGLSNASPVQEDEDRIRAAARRRLIKGAAVAPVLMSLASRPVMGAARRCSASGFMSGNVSLQPGQSPSCGGLSPGYWKNHTTWPAPYTPTTEFHSVFTSKSKYNYGTKSMQTVLNDYPGSFAFHAIACLLNAMSGFADYALKTGDVIKIWNDISTVGYYLTSTGKKMYEADAKKFFEDTYH